MADNAELERAILTLPSPLDEMGRHRLTDNVDMYGLLTKRGEDCVVACFAKQRGPVNGSARFD